MKLFKSFSRKPVPAPTFGPVRRSQLDNTEAGQENTDEFAPKFSRSSKKIVRVRATPGPRPTPASAVIAKDVEDPQSLNDILTKWKSKAEPDHTDIDDQPMPAPPPKVAEPEHARKPVPDRAKTRLLGFDNVTAPDLFEKTKPSVGSTTRYPVGWLVITDGPGRGESFTLLTGMSQIGRGEDQAVQLDFGDEAISRSNHAAIVYDIDTHSFLMGHGGKTNVVRLNGKPLITTETLKSGDKIRIGETVLQLVVFSTPARNWSGGVGDVAQT